MNHVKRFSLVAISLLLVFGASFAGAQLGEVAGGLNFNVSLGGSQTSNTFTIVNAGNSTIGFSIINPAFNQIPNSTTPTVIISPMNGTLAPHSNLRIDVTVIMPTGQDKPGMRWDGFIQVLSVLANSDNPGGAVIQTGVAKEIIIVAAPEQYNWFLIGGAVVVVAVVAYLAYRRFGKKMTRKKGKGTSSRTARLPALVKGKPKRRRRKTTARRASRKAKGRKRRRR